MGLRPINKDINEQLSSQLDQLISGHSKTTFDVKNEQAEVPSIPHEKDILDKTPIRRAKVKELSNIGYDAYAISDILSRGIKLGDGTRILVKCDVDEIKSDLRYIVQESAAEDTDFIKNRQDVISKLRYIYSRSMQEFIGSTDTNKNAYLNTALAAVRELKEVHGVTQVDKFFAKTQSEKKAENLVPEISKNKLTDKERNELLGALNSVLAGS